CRGATVAPHHESSHLAATVMKRLAPLVIAALVACSNSPTALDLSTLDLSGRWTLVDSATAVQVDTDRVYATVVARGTVVLPTTDPNAMGCGRAVSLFTRLGSAPHPSSCKETLLLVKQ